jgi:hypothetical protein
MYLCTHRISLSTEALALDVIPDGDPVVWRGQRVNGGDTRMSYENMVKMRENDDKPSNLIGDLKHFCYFPQ